MSLLSLSYTLCYGGLSLAQVSLICDFLFLYSFKTALVEPANNRCSFCQADREH